MIWYILTTVVSFSLVSCYQFQFLSTYHETLWVGVQPMPNMDLLEDGGFILHPGEKVSVFKVQICFSTIINFNLENSVLKSL